MVYASQQNSNGIVYSGCTEFYKGGKGAQFHKSQEKFYSTLGEKPAENTNDTIGHRLGSFPTLDEPGVPLNGIGIYLT